MKTLLFVISLFCACGAFPSDGFRQLKRSEVPHEAIHAICPDIQNYNCYEDFRKNGSAYTVDVNDDGKEEILVHLGFADSGSGGDGYSLLQKTPSGWREIDGEGWLLYNELRLRKLERTRGGYHDLRLGRTLLVKWDGEKYVPYGERDYKSLSPSLFDANDPEDMELLWLIRYSGAAEFLLEPQWIARPQKICDWATLNDPARRMTWMSCYKGGLWGVSGTQAFLLLPRATYLGASDLKMEGDWLVIYGDPFTCGPSTSHVEVARYHLRSRQLRVGHCAQVPFEDN